MFSFSSFRLGAFELIRRIRLFFRFANYFYPSNNWQWFSRVSHDWSLIPGSIEYHLVKHPSANTRMRENDLLKQCWYSITMDRWERSKRVMSSNSINQWERKENKWIPFSFFLNVLSDTSQINGVAKKRKEQSCRNFFPRSLHSSLLSLVRSFVRSFALSFYLWANAWYKHIAENLSMSVFVRRLQDSDVKRY